jgi:cysteine desulfurase
MSARLIYLDNQATTRLDPRVLDAMLPYLSGEYGNPSSAHAYGRAAADAVGRARASVAALVGARYPEEIIFTSGATEANHLALAGTSHTPRNGKTHLVTTAIEHKSILALCERLAATGTDATVVSVGRDGIVDLQELEAVAVCQPTIVSIIHANNEIGVIQPLAEASKIARRHDALVHTDAAQSLAGAEFDVDRLGIDLASLSAHKLYGPKGVGALYIRKGTARPEPTFAGGGPEWGLRPGTLNVPGIVGFGEAARILAGERERDLARISGLRDELHASLLRLVPGLSVNGSLQHRLAGNLNVTIPGIEATDLLRALPDIALSTGSACNTGNPEPSHVLLAIGLSRAAARSALRISLGRFTSRGDIEQAAARIGSVANKR